jgi:hypothetical protein
MPRPRRNRPQNMGQNRNVQMRNNARRTNPFSSNQVFKGGLDMANRLEQPQQCPNGQQPVKGPDGKMTCQAVGPPKPKIRNNGAY